MATPHFVDDQLNYPLDQANYALCRNFDAHVRATGLTSIEWRVLATLHDGPPLTVSELAPKKLPETLTQHP